MTTAAEFIKSGIKGSTFEAVKKAFGKPLTEISEDDKVMANYALGFAWYVEQGEPPTTAHAHVMSLTMQQVADLFEDSNDPAAAAAADFD